MGCGGSKTNDDKAVQNPNKPGTQSMSVPSKEHQPIQQTKSNQQHPNIALPSKTEVLSQDAKPGTIVQTFTGILYDNVPFQDCLITNEEELESKLKKFIAAQVPKYTNKQYSKPDVSFVPNDADEILNNRFKFDFQNFDLIVFNSCKIGGVNVNKNNNYEVRPSQECTSDISYTAVLVKSPQGVKPNKFILMGAKPQPYVEQRAMNFNPEFDQIEQIPDFHD